MKCSPQLPLVLIVDDDFEWAEFVRTELSEICDVLHASDASEAMQILGDRRIPAPALIILDVVIPGSQDGFSLLRSLRQEECTSQIPVIMASSINSAADMAFGSGELQKYLGVAPVEFLDKPVAARKLQQAVKAVLARDPGVSAG